MSNVLSTVGLLASQELFDKPRLVRVNFEWKEGHTYVKAVVLSGHTLCQIRRLGFKIITRQRFRDMPEDPYDDLAFARAAFKLFGLET